MCWCDKHDVGYLLGLPRNQVLERRAQPWITVSASQFAQTQEKQRLFGEFAYAAGTWDRERRVIVKAEHLGQGPNSRFVVTDLAGAPDALYDDLYCARGDAENRIKEQQLGLFADGTSCHDFVANQFRLLLLLLSAAAYLLLETLRRETLKETELAQAQVETIRRTLLKIGARVVSSVRRDHGQRDLQASGPLAPLQVLIHMGNPEGHRGPSYSCVLRTTQCGSVNLSECV
jgi:hypothetical protein